MSGRLEEAIERRTVSVAVIGLGYVGMPAARAIARAGFSVTGYDRDAQRVRLAGADAERLSAQGPGRLTLTASAAGLDGARVVLICVPTDKREDGGVDLGAVQSAASEAALRAAPSALFVLESTVAPGTTRTVVETALKAAGRHVQQDFILHAPEREDPGHTERTVGKIPRVLGASDAAARRVGRAFYEPISPEVVMTRSIEAAEMAKLTENAFRAVNIAFANEVKETCQGLGIDSRDVINAAASKPFGFMRFDPGPGTGGHCIPVDPWFMVCAARTAGAELSVLPAALAHSEAEPNRVVARALAGLKARRGEPVAAADILVLGMAYKKNVADTRESPGMKVIDRLIQRGVCATYHDPHVPAVTVGGDTRLIMSEALTAERLRQTALVIVVTDHDAIDWSLVAAEAPLVADARGVLDDSNTVFAV